MPSRLNTHGLNNTSDAREMTEAGQRVAKLVGDFGASTEYKRINPGITIIGREISVENGTVRTAENLMEQFPNDPIGAARHFFNLQKPKYELNPDVDLWEGPNEPAFESEDTPRDVAISRYRWYGEFEAERVRLLAGMTPPRRAVVGCFSVGTPEIQEDDISRWEAFMPACREAFNHRGALGLHEYAQKSFVAGLDQRREGWTTFRYRKVRRLALKPAGLERLPIELTEYGSDFKKYPDVDYVVILIEADNELRLDPDVEAEIFTYGDGGNPNSWGDFDVSTVPAVAKGITDHVRAKRNEPDPVGPPPVEPPISTRFKIGDRCKVNVDSLNVRDTPGGRIIGSQVGGMLGTVIDGPVAAMNSGKMLAWWKVNNDAGVDGWMAESFPGKGDYLVKFVDVPLPPASTKFKIGDRVEVVNFNALSVRVSPAGAFLGAQIRGSLGKITGGPVLASLDGHPIVWWLVDNDSGVDGWMSENGLGIHLVIPPPSQELVNLLFNHAFQNKEWFTDEFGNQQPKDWQYKIWSPGEVLPFPTHRDQGSILPAICTARPENVHKLINQLPTIEHPGQPMQLIFPGMDAVYKSFGDQGAIATRLGQAMISDRTGIATFTAWVLVDAPDKPTAPSGKLEDDHTMVRLSVGATSLNFDYGLMSTRFHISGVNRPWNLLTVSRSVNPGESMDAELILQKNWKGPTSFFVGPCSLTIQS